MPVSCTSTLPTNLDALGPQFGQLRQACRVNTFGNTPSVKRLSRGLSVNLDLSAHIAESTTSLTRCPGLMREAERRRREPEGTAVARGRVRQRLLNDFKKRHGYTDREPVAGPAIESSRARRAHNVAPVETGSFSGAVWALDNIVNLNAFKRYLDEIASTRTEAIAPLGRGAGKTKMVPRPKRCHEFWKGSRRFSSIAVAPKMSSAQLLRQECGERDQKNVLLTKRVRKPRTNEFFTFDEPQPPQPAADAQPERDPPDSAEDANQAPASLQPESPSRFRAPRRVLKREQLRLAPDTADADLQTLTEL
eukprot:m.90980 g.90980  ORF g.90980 m.90980 type:complete len:307 (-) comp11900_c0_seq3:158-1078(-)